MAVERQVCVHLVEVASVGGTLAVVAQVEQLLIERTSTLGLGTFMTLHYIRARLLRESWTLVIQYSRPRLFMPVP
jgi:hypothetical protein